MMKILTLILTGLTAVAQTKVDLRTQVKNVDFTRAASTRPVKAGTVLPSTCEVGELYFKTDAPVGANLYGCATANQWSGIGGLSSQNCWYDGNDQTLKCMDTNGSIFAAVKTASGATLNQWVDYIDAKGAAHTSQPTAAAVGAVADPGSNGVPYRSGTGMASPATADNLSGPFFCQDQGGGSSFACNLTPPIDSYKTGTTYWFRANGVNAGAATVNFNSIGAKQIVKQSDQPLAAGDIKTGQWVMVTYDGTNMQMQSQTANAAANKVSSVFGRSGTITGQTGDYTTAQVTENGNLYFTNARARAAFSATGAISLNASTGALDCPGCLTTGAAADTDLIGGFPHLSVVKLQGRAVASTAPADLQYLGWNASAQRWEPKTPPSAAVSSIFGRSGAIVAGNGDYTTAQVTENGNLYFTNPRARAAFSATGPITLDGAVGAIACPTCITSTMAADTDLYGNFPHLGVGRLQGRPVASTAPADLQYLGWNTSANRWEPKALPDAPVGSVFGRTGVIAPQTGDYSFTQISGVASASQLPAVALRTDQSNTVTAGTQDLRAAEHTLPMKSGTTAQLPGTCTPGEAYFATDAPLGNNVYGCTAANAWTAQGLLTVKSDGHVIGRRNSVNFQTGAGLVTVMTDDGQQANVMTALDTAVVQTQAGEQSGSALMCISAGGSASHYTCLMSPTTSTYAKGMVLHWTPDVNGQGGSTTLNVDALGDAPVRMADGVSNPGASDILAGRMYAIWYDGSGFRLPGTSGCGNSGGGGASTVNYTFQGVTQGGVAGWNLSYDALTNITAGATDSTHITPTWVVTAATTGSPFRSRSTVTGTLSNVVFTATVRSTDSTNAGSMAISYACLAAGTAVDAPSFTALTAIPLTTIAATKSVYQSTQAVTCAGTATSPAELYVKWTPTAPSGGTLSLIQLAVSY